MLGQHQVSAFREGTKPKICIPNILFTPVIVFVASVWCNEVGWNFFILNDLKNTRYKTNKNYTFLASYLHHFNHDPLPSTYLRNFSNRQKIFNWANNFTNVPECILSWQSQQEEKNLPFQLIHRVVACEHQARFNTVSSYFGRITCPTSCEHVHNACLYTLIKRHVINHQWESGWLILLFDLGICNTAHPLQSLQKSFTCCVL